MNYEVPEVFELGRVEETILTCGCSNCDCGGQQSSDSSVSDEFDF
jgi:hypothetical protein